MEIENLRLQSEIDSIIDKIYPIGSIYMSISPTNPEETIGGAWVPWGQGKVPVGVDTSDSDFNSVEKTGGEKRHTLTVDEMPSHGHQSRAVRATWSDIERRDCLSSLCQSSNTQGVNQGWSNFTDNLDESANQRTGGNQPHNNLQPYITCHMWKRVNPGYYYDYTSTNSPDIIYKDMYLGNSIENVKNRFNADNPNRCTYCKIKTKDIKPTNCEEMIYNNDTLLQIDLSEFDTSEVVYMDSMFYGCNAVWDIDLSNFDTSKVTDMHNMFNGCSSLTSLDLSSFDTSKVWYMAYMFSGCSALHSLDISNFIFRSGVSTTSMFSGIPTNCEILVKNQTAKNFVLGVRSDLTNVQIKS